MSRSYGVSGNIKPTRFVKGDASNAGKVLQATAGGGAHGDPILGISEEGTHLPPWSPLDDGYAATATAGGDSEIKVYQEGDECLLCVGAAVTAFDDLKADSDGRGITGTVSGDLIGAVALETATVAGQLIRALVTIKRKV